MNQCQSCSGPRCATCNPGAILISGQCFGTGTTGCSLGPNANDCASCAGNLCASCNPGSTLVNMPGACVANLGIVSTGFCDQGPGPGQCKTCSGALCSSCNSLDVLQNGRYLQQSISPQLHVGLAFRAVPPVLGLPTEIEISGSQQEWDPTVFINTVASAFSYLHPENIEILSDLPAQNFPYPSTHKVTFRVKDITVAEVRKFQPDFFARLENSDNNPLREQLQAVSWRDPSTCMLGELSGMCTTCAGPYCASCNGMETVTASGQCLDTTVGTSSFDLTGVPRSQILIQHTNSGLVLSSTEPQHMVDIYLQNKDIPTVPYVDLGEYMSENGRILLDYISVPTPGRYAVVAKDRYTGSIGVSPWFKVFSPRSAGNGEPCQGAASPTLKFLRQAVLQIVGTPPTVSKLPTALIISANFTGQSLWVFNAFLPQNAIQVGDGSLCRVCEQPERRQIRQQCLLCNNGFQLLNGQCTLASDLDDSQESGTGTVLWVGLAVGALVIVAVIAVAAAFVARMYASDPSGTGIYAMEGGYRNPLLTSSPTLLGPAPTASPVVQLAPPPVSSGSPGMIEGGPVSERAARDLYRQDLRTFWG
eukprot:gene228-364_t